MTAQVDERLAALEDSLTELLDQMMNLVATNEELREANHFLLDRLLRAHDGIVIERGTVQ